MKAIDTAIKGILKVFIYFGISMSTKLNEVPLLMTLVLAAVMISIGYTTVKAIQKATEAL
jgi:hypothetical protein